MPARTRKILFIHTVMIMDVRNKLEILADAAKYDASCASSGAPKRTSEGQAGFGATTGMGICHSYTPDGRCVSLLKILLTNFCIYDCQYCVNRRSSNVPRARFSVREVVKLTTDFYLRNYIDGLFLSSGIIQSADYTMGQLVEIARQLREEHQFRGYIHLKTIPDADPELIAAAGRYADRLSVKIAMGAIRRKLDEKAEEPKAPRFAPAGQSTQMIVGADASDDRTILSTAETLYGSYRLKRVYYSAFSPIPDSPTSVPLQPPPLLREHRLYQADFLLRGYGFKVQELLPQTGDLALDVDPKLAWALAHREHFPVDLNCADSSLIARIPGIGLRNAKRLIELRRLRRVRYADLVRLRCSMKKLAPFIVTADYRPALEGAPSEQLRRSLGTQPRQLDLWGAGAA
jgi:predicted DNA-binding helix-hairpin-helix protein